MSRSSISLIVTVLNEAKTIASLLASIKNQLLLPAEVMIVDGGSTDQTRVIIQKFAAENPHLKIFLTLAKGNRSLGRNTAIKLAKAEWIAITDAGCQLDQNWLSELAKKQAISQAEVVAGYYQGRAESNFQTGLIPYVLVMPDKLPKSEAEIFLPATRSMLISKKAWDQAGRFDETLSHNEDYALAHQLVKTKVKMAFCPTALVYWQPPTGLSAAAKMFYRFAKGDCEARIWRPKVGLIFGRYLFVLIGALLLAKTNFLSWFLGLNLIIYISWAVLKNFDYAKSGWHWLPVLQITSDLAVMAGTISGWLGSFDKQHQRHHGHA